jgi:hypothetical protein
MPIAEYKCVNKLATDNFYSITVEETALQLTEGVLDISVLFYSAMTKKPYISKLPTAFYHFHHLISCVGMLTKRHNADDLSLPTVPLGLLHRHFNWPTTFNTSATAKHLNYCSVPCVLPSSTYYVKPAIK